MPIEGGSNQVHGQPSSQPPVQPPIQPPGNQNPPAPSADENPGSNPSTKVEKEIQRAEYWLIGIGIATILVNIGIGTIYYSQLTQMTRVTKATEQAAYAACKSAKIANSTLEEIRSGSPDTYNLSVGSITQAETTTRAEGAAIFINRNPFVTFLPNSDVTVPVTVKNSGKSAALNVSLAINARFVAYRENPVFSYPSKDTVIVLAGSVFPDDPPSTFTMTVKENGKRVRLDQPAFDRLQAGKTYLSVYGKITYRDIFGKPRWAHFCTHVGGSQAITNQYQKCAAYNETDTVTLPPTRGPYEPGTREEISCPLQKDE